MSRTQDLEMSLSILPVKDFFGWWRVALVESRQPTYTDMVIARLGPYAYATIGIEASEGDIIIRLRLGGILSTQS